MPAQPISQTTTAAAETQQAQQWADTTGMAQGPPYDLGIFSYGWEELGVNFDAELQLPDLGPLSDFLADPANATPAAALLSPLSDVQAVQEPALAAPLEQTPEVLAPAPAGQTPQLAAQTEQAPQPLALASGASDAPPSRGTKPRKQPSPRSGRKVGKNSCRECKKAHVTCKKEDGKPRCDYCEKKHFDCVFTEDNRTNLAADSILQAKIGYLNQVYEWMWLTLQFLLSTDDDLTKNVVTGLIQNASPEATAAFIKGRGFTTTPPAPLRFVGDFEIKYAIYDKTKLAALKRASKQFSQMAKTWLEGLQDATWCLAQNTAPEELLGPLRTGSISLMDYNYVQALGSVPAAPEACRGRLVEDLKKLETGEGLLRPKSAADMAAKAAAPKIPVLTGRPLRDTTCRVHKLKHRSQSEARSATAAAAIVAAATATILPPPPPTLAEEMANDPSQLGPSEMASDHLPMGRSVPQGMAPYMPDPSWPLEAHISGDFLQPPSLMPQGQMVFPPTNAYMPINAYMPTNPGVAMGFLQPQGVDQLAMPQQSVAHNPMWHQGLAHRGFYMPNVEMGLGDPISEGYGDMSQIPLAFYPTPPDGIVPGAAGFTPQQINNNSAWANGAGNRTINPRFLTR